MDETLKPQVDIAASETGDPEAFKAGVEWVRGRHQTEFAPCPFCGSTWILKGDRYFAICVDCGATGPERGNKNSKWKGDWNKRASLIKK